MDISVFLLIYLPIKWIIESDDVLFHYRDNKIFVL